MKINVNGELKELNIIDPATGIDWIMDLLGNYGATMRLDNECVYMEHNEFEWWDYLCKRYEDADNCFYTLLQEADECERRLLITEKESINCDLEDYPYMLAQVCHEFENKKQGENKNEC